MPEPGDEGVCALCGNDELNHQREAHAFVVEVPITPGEIESCVRCMRLVRSMITGGRVPANFRELSSVHAILHRAPWEPLP